MGQYTASTSPAAVIGDSRLLFSANLTLCCNVYSCSIPVSTLCVNVTLPKSFILDAAGFEFDQLCCLKKEKKATS